jgi:transcriptional regulator with XRE-family HTH domain
MRYQDEFMTLYERIQEIKQATGWSQERISTEAGLALSTISRILRVPGYEPNETSRSLIYQLHQNLVAQPFPADLERLFILYDRWKETYSQSEFSEHLNTVEWLLRHHQFFERTELSSCRLRWLLGHVYYDRAFYLRHNLQENAARALKHYESALALLDAYPDKPFVVHKYKLRQCIVSTKFNLLPADKRRHSSEICAWLRTLRYLELVAQVSAENPWNWMAIRNGLVAAAILEDLDYCLLFWRALKNANKRFEDLSFAPSKDLPALGEDPDVSWFIRQLNQANH